MIDTMVFLSTLQLITLFINWLQLVIMIVFNIISRLYAYIVVNSSFLLKSVDNTMIQLQYSPLSNIINITKQFLALCMTLALHKEYASILVNETCQSVSKPVRFQTGL